MDYEKLHKDTIAKLQEMVNSGKITEEIACGICSDFVPESEDERIRKAIYNCVKWFGFDSCFFKDVSQEKCIAWLEKQGEQKSTEWSEEDEKMLDIILNDINYAQKNFSDSKLIPYIRKVVWLKSLKDMYIWKPSEEQLDALETAVSACQSDTLAVLYNTLKSL